jgi:hypothetical protein
MAARTLIAALAFLTFTGCSIGSSDSKRAGDAPAVKGTVDLAKPQAGAPDAGTAAGHGNDLAVATTASDVFSFTGRVDPPDSHVEASDGVVRVEPTGRFTVGLASPRSGMKSLRLSATHPGRRPWSFEVRVTRGAAVRVAVPERDEEAPSAAVLLAPGGGVTPIVQPSPSKAGERPEVVRLAQPAFRAHAAVRDASGGTGRIRLSIESRTRCGKTGRTEVRTLPPAQIVTIALPPGARAPVERQRSELVRLKVGDGCSVTGEVFAEGTDAHGRQAVTAHAGFKYP